MLKTICIQPDHKIGVSLKVGDHNGRVGGLVFNGACTGLNVGTKGPRFLQVTFTIAINIYEGYDDDAAFAYAGTVIHTQVTGCRTDDTEEKVMVL